MDLFGEAKEINEEYSLSDPVDCAEEKTLCEPRQMQFCLGHEEQEQQLLSMIAKSRLPHGLIFSGIKGIGKATFAHRLVRYLISLPVKDTVQDALFDTPAPPASITMESNAENTNVRLYLAGAHPDCLVVSPAFDDAKGVYKAGLDVAQIRKIEPFLRKTSSQGGWRTVLIDEADTMNRSAQNALLKILEEPPKKTLIILIAHRAGKLIPTIHSRAQVMLFQALDTDDFNYILAKHDGPSPLASGQQGLLWGLSNGSVGKAIEILESEGLDLLASFLSAFEHGKADWGKAHPLAETIGSKHDERSYRIFSALLLEALSRVIQAKARGGVLPDYLANYSALHALYHRASPQALLDLHETLSAELERCLYANLDKKQVVLQAIGLISKQIHALS